MISERLKKFEDRGFTVHVSEDGKDVIKNEDGVEVMFYSPKEMAYKTRVPNPLGPRPIEYTVFTLRQLQEKGLPTADAERNSSAITAWLAVRKDRDGFFEGVSRDKLKEIIKEELQAVLNEDGHTDVSSARRQAKLAIEDSQDILQHLEGFSAEQDLPSWWMKKVSLASAYLNSARDYLLTSGEPMNEMTDAEKAQKCAASERLYDKALSGDLGEKFVDKQIAKAVEKGKYFDCDWVKRRSP
jgi:hypothetical protein